MPKRAAPVRVTWVEAVPGRRRTADRAQPAAWTSVKSIIRAQASVHASSHSP